MEIVYCEKCGKRMSEEETGQAGPAAGGRLCRACAPPLKASGLRSAPGAAGAAPRVTKRLGSAGGAVKTQGRPMVVLVAVLVVVGGLVLAVTLLKSEEKRPPGGPKSPPVTEPRAKPDGSPPVPVRPPTSSPASATAAPKTSETPKVEETDEQRADRAFEQLTRELQALPEDDKVGRIGRLEGFLRQHGESIVAARARVMMVQIQSPAAPTPTVPAQQNPPAPAAPVDLGPDPEGEPVKLFNEKDLSNWSFSGGGNAAHVRVEDGVMVIAPEFAGRIETAAPSARYLFEIEFYMENATGAHLEIQCGGVGIFFDRSASGQWVKARGSVGSGPIQVKVLAGTGNPVVTNSGEPGRFRIYLQRGAAKKIRLLNLYDRKAP